MKPQAHRPRGREPTRPVRTEAIRPLPAGEQTDATPRNEAAEQLKKFEAILEECSRPATPWAIEQLLERMRSRGIP